MAESIRPDHKIILEMVKPNAKVLDLGCGNGELLHLLMSQNSCSGTGIEIDEQEIYRCMEKGVTICQGDIDTGLKDYLDKAFDYVILNESLQEIRHAERVIMESLRVGKHVIVGIPNFCNLSARLQIFFKGQVPVTHWLPYTWYNTPNIRFLSLKDFRVFCKERSITIEQERDLAVNKEVSFMSNVFASVGLFLLKKN